MNITTPLSRHLPQTGDAARSPDQLAASEAGTEQDHYSALVRMLSEVSQDHAQLRTFIYEFARVTLRKKLYSKFLDGAWSEVNEQVRALEAAIDQIEADFQNSAPRLRFESEPALGHRTTPSLPVRRGLQKTGTFGDDAIQDRSLLIRSPKYAETALPIISDGNDRLANAFIGKQLHSTFWWNTQLVVAAAIGIAIFATADVPSVVNRLALYWQAQPSPAKATAEIERKQNPAAGGEAVSAKSNETNRTRTADLPVPTEYGAFAVINGKLNELEPLPIRVPDSRVAISAAISAPSRTHFPAAQLQFVIFRRDLLNNAPDRVPVRVVAQVMRALTFDTAGHPKTTNLEQSWVIRNNSYTMKVAPLGDNPEMIVIRPDPANFVFPAGRYALVLKGVGYDFTVDGPVTDTAHCLERTDALNVPIYSECRKL